MLKADIEQDNHQDSEAVEKAAIPASFYNSLQKLITNTEKK